MPVIHKTDVLIVGAGICGLYAASQLLKKGKSVCILEAGSRVGGRIETIHNKFFIPLESGAEFIHGDLPRTKALGKKAKSKILTQKDGFYIAEKNEVRKTDEMIKNYNAVRKKLKEPEQDIPLSVFLNQYLSGEEFSEARRSLQRMAEGFDVADIEKLSTFFFREELKEISREKMFRFENGYGALIEHLYEEIIDSDGIIILNATEIARLSDLGFVLAEGKFQVWWTQRKDLPVITGWAGGPNARLMKHASEREIMEHAISSLAGALKTTETFLRTMLSAFHVSNWGAFPFFEGAYSYNTPQSEAARKLLITPVDDMLYFAGEALNETNEIGTVEAALASAEQVVKKLVS